MKQVLLAVALALATACICHAEQPLQFAIIEPGTPVFGFNGMRTVAPKKMIVQLIDKNLYTADIATELGVGTVRTTDLQPLITQPGS